MIITDRLHCMLLCVLTKTPCIFYDNSTHKLSGTYEHIKKLRYIKPVEGANSDELIKQMLSGELMADIKNETFIEKYKELIAKINE